MRRLDRALAQPGAFAVIWGRRRVGKSRLLIEWSRRHKGLYTVAEQSAPSMQRRYLATAVAERFPGFADVDYPDWRSFFLRLSAEADQAGWRGPFVLDEPRDALALLAPIPSEPGSLRLGGTVSYGCPYAPPLRHTTRSIRPLRTRATLLARQRTRVRRRCALSRRPASPGR